MKLSKIIASLALMLHVTSMVHADRLVRILLNNGKEESNSGECDASDNAKIENIITISGNNLTYARNLRSTNHASRGLQYYPPKCKKNCEGFAPKTCKATDCVGYRRSLSSGKSFSCSAQVEFINEELDKLVNQSLVSSNCKKLLEKPRKSDCYDDVVFGVVERMVLWNATTATPTVINSQYNGQDICKNARVDFEPITNSCVDMLFTTVTGPNNFYKDSNRNDDDDDDDESPTASRTVFGNGGDDDNPSGIIFPYLGAYTIKSVPDGFQDKALTIPFNVVTGSVDAVRLWNTTTKIIMDSKFKGGTICRNKNFNLEVLLSSCATKFKATLTGPSGYSRTATDSSRPFSIFGDSSGTFIGRTLTTLGVYNFTIYPDQLVSTEVTSILFNVENCEL